MMADKFFAIVTLMTLLGLETAQAQNFPGDLIQVDVTAMEVEVTLSTSSFDPNTRQHSFIYTLSNHSDYTLNGPFYIEVFAINSEIAGDTVTVINNEPVPGAANPVIVKHSAGLASGAQLNYILLFQNSGDGMFTFQQNIYYVSVAAGNTPPVANDDYASCFEDSSIQIESVLLNDSDVDGDILNLAAADVISLQGGLVTHSGNGVFIYTPAVNFNGQDRFEYAVSDGRGGSASASVLIQVMPVNDAPIALDDYANTVQNVAVDIAVVTNDSDIDGDALSVTAISTPANGAAMLDVNQQTVRYTPNDAFTGMDSFTYTLSDPAGSMASATVTVSVAEPFSDQDQDGVADALDECPATPPGQSVDAEGCADNQRDDDIDGIYNDRDLCPQTTVGEVVNLNGCSATQLDQDGDGIFDALDLCLQTPDGEPVDAKGCAGSQRDSDGDGVRNPKDLCPNTRHGLLPDDNGCAASQRDSDGDGVNDAEDALPENPNETQDSDQDGIGNIADQDDDGDTIADSVDNCPLRPNGKQQDADGDGIGDRCEIQGVVQITAPLNGQTLTTATSHVSGTVTAPDNTGVIINGRRACRYGDGFYLNHLRLQSGANNIEAVLQVPASLGSRAAVLVQRDGNAPFSLTADRDCGHAPLSVQFALQTNNAQLKTLNIDYANSDCPAAEVNNLQTELSCVYTQPGVYRVTAQAEDNAARRYPLSLTIVVQNRQTTEAHVQQVWQNFHSALVAGDQDTAMQYISGESRALYGPIISTLLADMPDILNEWTEPALLRIDDRIAEYALLRERNGEVKLFIIQFVKDRDGVWRVMGM